MPKVAGAGARYIFQERLTALPIRDICHPLIRKLLKYYAIQCTIPMKRPILIFREMSILRSINLLINLENLLEFTFLYFVVFED